MNRSYCIGLYLIWTFKVQSTKCTPKIQTGIEPLLIPTSASILNPQNDRINQCSIFSQETLLKTDWILTAPSSDIYHTTTENWMPRNWYSELLALNQTKPLNPETSLKAGLASEETARIRPTGKYIYLISLHYLWSFEIIYTVFTDYLRLIVGLFAVSLPSCCIVCDYLSYFLKIIATIICIICGFFVGFFEILCWIIRKIFKTNNRIIYG